MNAQFAHYWREGVILTEEEREHQWKIAQALNQGFVFTVPEGSILNEQIFTDNGAGQAPLAYVTQASPHLYRHFQLFQNPTQQRRAVKMNDEKTNNEVTTLETLQNSLVVLTAKTMKSNLTKTIDNLDNLDKESKLSNTKLRQVYSDLRKELSHVDNLIAALETLHKFIDKDRIPMGSKTNPKRQ